MLIAITIIIIKEVQIITQLIIERAIEIKIIFNKIYINLVHKSIFNKINIKAIYQFCFKYIDEQSEIQPVLSSLE